MLSFPTWEVLREGAEHPQLAAQELQEKTSTRHTGTKVAKDPNLTISSFHNPLLNGGVKIYAEMFPVHSNTAV
jgi:hypothetical protein